MLRPAVARPSGTVATAAKPAATPALEGRPYKELRVGIPKELFEGERRVAGTPESVSALVKTGYKVLVQAGAGAEASFRDEYYTAAGAEVVSVGHGMGSV